MKHTNSLNSGSVIRVLHVSNMFPSMDRPTFGSFVKDQIDSLRKLPELDIDFHAIEGLKGSHEYLKGILPLARHMREGQDLIHCHFGHAGSLVKLLAPSCPVVTSYCGSDLLGTLKNAGNLHRTFLMPALNKFMSKHDTWSIIKSENLRPYLRQIERVSVIPNGVDTSLFSPLSRDVAVARLGLDRSRKYVLFPSDPALPVKNYQLFVDALRTADKQCEVNVLHFGQKVNHAEVPFYMNAAHAVVLTSRHEGSPNVIKEALGCNRPIVSVPVGDVRELLAGVKNARVVEASPEAVGRAIVPLLDNFESSNGRDQLRCLQLDSASVAQRILAIYRLMLNRPARQ